MTTRNLLFSSLILSSLFIACGDDKDGRSGDGDGDASGGSVNGDGDGDASGGSNSKPSGGSSGNPSGGSNGNPSGGSNGNPSGGSNGEGSGGKGSGGDGEGGDAGDGDGDGEGGQGGAMNTCDETGDFPTFNVQARSDDPSWAENDFDDVAVTEDECGIATLAVEWPHEAGWEGADPGEANQEATKFSLEFPYTQDLTGKRLNLKIRQKENGRGTSATNGGIDVYLGAQDRSGFTEFFTPYEDGKENQPGYWGGAYNDGDMLNLSLNIDDAGPDFDPTDVFKIFVRISNKFWGDGTDPVFDYEITELELISLTITDAP